MDNQMWMPIILTFITGILELNVAYQANMSGDIRARNIFAISGILTIGVGIIFFWITYMKR